MSDAELSPSTKALLAAARRDGPSLSARTEMWRGIDAVVNAGSMAGAAGASAAPAAKMLLTGMLLGGTVTVGLALVLLHVSPSGPTRAPTPASLPTVAHVAPAPPLESGGDRDEEARADSEPSVVDQPEAEPAAPTVQVQALPVAARP